MFNKLIGEAKGIFNVITLIELVFYLILVMMGIILYTQGVSYLLVSFLLIINASISLFAYFKRGRIDLYNNNLIIGVILLIIGIISLFLSNSLKVILAIYFIVISFQKIIYGIFLKKYNEPTWMLILVMGLLLGIIAIISLFTNKEEIARVVSILLLGLGLMNLVSTILLRRRSKYFIE